MDIFDRKKIQHKKLLFFSGVGSSDIHETDPRIRTQIEMNRVRFKVSTTERFHEI